MLGKPFQNLVSTKERWSLEDWNRNQPGNEEKKLLAEWLRQGHLEKVQTFAGQRSRPKMERWVRLLNPEAKGDQKEKTKKVQILENSNNLRKLLGRNSKQYPKSCPSPEKPGKGRGCRVFRKRVFRRFWQNRCLNRGVSATH